MSLKIQFDQDDLRPLVHLAVAEALDRMEEERAKLKGRLALTEPEAAVLLGVKPYVLRDCRRRGELQGCEDRQQDRLHPPRPAGLSGPTKRKSLKPA